MINWQEEFESLVRSIGSITYGKERWFYQGNNVWYDREDGEYIDTFTLQRRVTHEILLLEGETE